MKRMTHAQKTAMHRASKANGQWRIERRVTASALIGMGLMGEVTLPIAPTKGVAVTLTKAGHDWIRNNC